MGAGKPPTYDFQSWDGVLFEPAKRAMTEADKERLKRRSKKQNPGTTVGTPLPNGRDIRGNGQISQNIEHRPNGRDITSLTSSLHLEAVGGGAPHSAVAAADERPDWATPVLTEVFGKERDRVLRNLAKIPIEKYTKRKQAREEFEAEMAAGEVDLSLSRRRRV